MPQLKNYSKLLANPTRAFGCAGQWLTLVLLASSVSLSAQEARVNPTGAAVKEFLNHVKTYVDLQKKEDDGLPKEAAREDPSKTVIRQRALAARIRLARSNAQPGDIFGSAGPLIRDIVLKDAQNRSAKDKKAAMEEVPKQNPPKVNAEYPEKADLATVPPLLLDQLPRLPEGLEYRFMGRDLILRDTKANLIADFIHEAVPIVKQ